MQCSLPLWRRQSGPFAVHAQSSAGNRHLDDSAVHEAVSDVAVNLTSSRSKRTADLRRSATSVDCNADAKPAGAAAGSRHGATEAPDEVWPALVPVCCILKPPLVAADVIFQLVCKVSMS